MLLILDKLCVLYHNNHTYLELQFENTVCVDRQIINFIYRLFIKFSLTGGF